MTLKNSLSFAPDAVIMSTKQSLIPIIDLSYYTNTILISNQITDDNMSSDSDSQSQQKSESQKSSLVGINSDQHLVHPKTLVYVIQYKSAKSNEEKTSILLGRNMDKTTVTGYDIKKSGLLEYLGKHGHKIINKSGFVIPCLWYVAKNNYKYAKVIYII